MLENPINFFEKYTGDEYDMSIKEKMAKAESEKVVIGNETFNRNEVDKITKHVLKNCNYFKNKSIYNNNNLKNGNGKLMFTNGMTLNEFSTKYSLPK